jgi:hypothetical protein
MPKPAKKTTKTTFTWDDVAKLNGGDRLQVSIVSGGSTTYLLDEAIEAGKKFVGRVVVIGEVK